MVAIVFNLSIWDVDPSIFQVGSFLNDLSSHRRGSLRESNCENAWLYQSLNKVLNIKFLIEISLGNIILLTTGGPVQYLFLSTHSFIVGRAHFSCSVSELGLHDSPTGVVPKTVSFSYITLRDHSLKCVKSQFRYATKGVI